MRDWIAASKNLKISSQLGWKNQARTLKKKQTKLDIYKYLALLQL